MSDRAGFLNSILDSPADDLPRLVFADFLRESDDPADQALGRFLWAGVTAARFRNADLIDDLDYYTAHREIEAVTVAGEPVRWLANLGLGVDPELEESWGWECKYDRVTVRQEGVLAVFARGMLSMLDMSFEKWCESASRILEASPLESVSITEVPGLSFSIVPKPGSWILVARLKVPTKRIPLMGGPIPSSVSPSPVLIETNADWGVEEGFPSRAALVSAAAQTSRMLANDLREAAGTRWPRPVRSRQ